MADHPIPNLTTIILTFNSQSSIDRVIEACQPLSTRVLVVDSYSSDTTPDQVRSHGCEWVQHEFENYSLQRNWAQAYADLDPESWVLHLDSDEVLSPELAQSMRVGLADPNPEIDGFLIQRLSYFLGKPLRYGYINPSWHLRLYRAGQGFCEDRLYDQHFVVPGPTQRLSGLLLDLQEVSLEKWIGSHNRWSTAEAEQVRQQLVRLRSRSTPEPQETSEVEPDRRLPETWTGDQRMRRRWLKNHLYYQSPPFLRAFLFFLYSYILRLGFLDGRVGLIYNVLQVFWFRFLVDAKLAERQIRAQSPLTQTDPQSQPPASEPTSVAHARDPSDLPSS